MDQKTRDKIQQEAVKQGILVAGGAVVGAVTKHALDPKKSTMPGGTPVAAQVASAMGAAYSNGATMGGVGAAGAAVLTAKVTAAAAVATAAAPFVLGAAAVGAGIWGAWKLIEYLDS